MAPGASPVQRSSLREQIADALRDEMLTGRLPAGGRFTVKEIAELYEVSATPVREALVDLAAQGLLEVEHHRGFQVRRFTLADFEAIVRARSLVVEGVFHTLGDQGMDTVAPEALASVRRRGEASVRASLAGQLDVLIGCDLRFWRELTALIGNAHIHDFLDRLRVQAWMFCVPYLREHGDLASVCWREHNLLVDAITEGDITGVRRVVRDFNEGSLAVMRRLAGSHDIGPDAPAGADAAEAPGTATGPESARAPGVPGAGPRHGTGGTDGTRGPGGPAGGPGGPGGPAAGGPGTAPASVPGARTAREDGRQDNRPAPRTDAHPGVRADSRADNRPDSRAGTRPDPPPVERPGAGAGAGAGRDRTEGQDRRVERALRRP